VALPVRELEPAAGDPGCSAPNPTVTHFCFISPNAVDIRFFQSSGPINLNPGETQTIVVAYITAPPVETDTLKFRGASFDLKPGLPATAAALAVGGGATDSLREIDKIIGAVSVKDKNLDGVIDQNEVVTVPRSLLNRGVWHRRCSTPSSCCRSRLTRRTSSWCRATTRSRGVARQRDGDERRSVLPDRLEPDVEAVRSQLSAERCGGLPRVRGRTTGDLQLVAQFDYGGTEMHDYTGAFNYVNCAPRSG